MANLETLIGNLNDNEDYDSVVLLACKDGMLKNVAIAGSTPEEVPAHLYLHGVVGSAYAAITNQILAEDESSESDTSDN